MNWRSLTSFFRRRAREREIEKFREDLRSMSGKNLSLEDIRRLREEGEKLKRGKLDEEEE